jgi:hypothetical protein
MYPIGPSPLSITVLEIQTLRFTFGQIVTLDIFKSTLLMVHVSPMHMLHQAKLECVVHLLVIKDKKIKTK